MGAAADTTITTEPLLPAHRRRPNALPGYVDFRGRPISPSASGGWTSAISIIGVEIAERFSFYGISSNLINYLTGPLHESTAGAAAAVNAWDGVASLLPLLGALVADSYLGRFRTIIFASLLYILGLGMLTLSSVSPAFQPTGCGGTAASISCQPSSFQLTFFFMSLYLVAFAQACHKPCVQAFGADQFDWNDPKERASRSSFFNWWYFGMCGGILVTVIFLSYVQDNIDWGLGFGIPCIIMILALTVFLLGIRTYRFYNSKDEGPITRLGKALITSGRNQQITGAADVSEASNPMSSDSSSSHSIMEDGYINSAGREGAEGVLRLFPIWATCLIYAVVFAQASTFFTKQGSTLDRRIRSKFQVPPAALQSFSTASTVAFIPVHELIIVPTCSKLSKLPSGVSMLQRIGTGMTLSALAMSIAALVEMKRLKTARDFGLIDQPATVVPMSLWWLVPQYVLFGIADAFTMVGLQEFFYDQVPDSLRSLGLALYLSIFGIGSFISAFMISAINKFTEKSGESWFSNNLNRAHLDYFYWLLAALSAFDLVIYFYFAQIYVYRLSLVQEY